MILSTGQTTYLENQGFFPSETPITIGFGDLVSLKQASGNGLQTTEGSQIVLTDKVKSLTKYEIRNLTVIVFCSAFAAFLVTNLVIFAKYNLYLINPILSVYFLIPNIFLVLTAVLVRGKTNEK